MNTLLDICDLGIGLLNEHSQDFSPGYASVQDKTLIFGESAQSVFRLQPNKSANQFWRDINTQKTVASFPGVRHQADLVWNHLNSLDNKKLLDIGFIAFPSHYARDQVALLSGVLQALKIQPSFLCKRSLLMGSQFLEAEYHLDFQLHQLVITRLIRENNEISCGEMTEHPGLGLLGCCDALLKGIQANFIEKTRFDPLHHAGTEQQLFNQIVGTLFQKPWSRIDLSVEIQGSVNSIELSENHLENAAKDYLERIEKVLPDEVYIVDSVFANLPINNSELARYLGPNELFGAAKKLKSELDTPTEFSELTAIQLSPNIPASFQEPTISEKSKTNESDNEESKEQVGSVINNAASDLASPTDKTIEPETPKPYISSNEYTTHILAGGLATPASDIYLVSKDSKLSWVKQSEHDASIEILGRLTDSDQGVVMQVTDDLGSGFRLNGKAISGQHLLKAEEVISHDKCLGTLIAICVIE